MSIPEFGNTQSTSARTKQEQLRSGLVTGFHYIVGGAGSSGSVVAGQLAANPDVRVLLIEAGGNDETESVLDPDQWSSNLGGGLDWSFTAAPNRHLNGRAILYSMGKVLGGGGSINVGIWSRGHKADWDFFAEASGDQEWGYNSILDTYRRVEGGLDGSSGPMWVQPAQNPHLFYAAALDSMSAQGMRRFDRLGGQLWEEPNGCAYVDEIVHNGRRQSPFRSYVYPRMHQSNLTVLTGAVLNRVYFDGQRASGVEFTHQGKTLRVDASLEIILSLGALETPKILMQSGIGDEAELKPWGIPLVQHLPAVGRHMHDHVAIGCAWHASDIDMPIAPRGQAVCFWKTDPSMSVPNALAFAIPIVYATPENGARFSLPTTGWSLFAGMASQGRGELHLTGPNPSDPLRVETNFLSDPQDLETALKVVAMCRSIGNDAALQRFSYREVLPGNLPKSDLEQFIRNGAGTFWHQSGGARMGRDLTSVVDSKLRVHGIDGLRIADASIMPRVTVGNTMAPCVVIGQRAVDILKSEHGT